ncbi:MAG: hypothetical protein LBC73_08710 [Oscillospiraceae bacterium]|jgi:hypothetical protein|nr:hypothetical protein [Oscillospiraceae bacterium]
MGLKMDDALYKGNKINVNDDGADIKYRNLQNLQCFNCSVPVSFVHSHKRDLGEKIITIKRYFRLKQNMYHKEGCKYTINGVLYNIYAACADGDLISKDNDVFVLRLLLITDDEKLEGSNRSSEKSENEKRNLNYITIGSKEKYLSTITGVMKLRDRVESNTDLEDTLKLKFHDWNGNAFFIPWKHFYFDADNDNDYSRLSKLLTKEKRYHPLCIAGYIRSVLKINSENQNDLYKLKLENVLRADGKWVSIDLWFNGTGINNYLADTEGSKAVIYTRFSYKGNQPWTSKAGKDYISCVIAGNINNYRQILLVKP